MGRLNYETNTKKADKTSPGELKPELRQIGFYLLGTVGVIAAQQRASLFAVPTIGAPDYFARIPMEAGVGFSKLRKFRVAAIVSFTGSIDPFAQRTMIVASNDVRIQPFFSSAVDVRLQPESPKYVGLDCSVIVHA
jgi:hypothetical protein